MQIVVLCFTALIIVFLILISLPKSNLGKTFLRIYGIVSYIITGLLALYAISPIDAVPDFIPVAGQGDDVAAIISAIGTAITGYVSLKKAAEKLKSRNNQ